MHRLRTLGRLGTGKIGVLLPDTMTSPRYSEFDAPYLARALQAAGLRRSQFFITNAQGSDATEQAQAESDMTQGATVLLLDPIDSGVGASIESAAASLGVKVIDYDRMTLGGTLGLLRELRQHGGGGTDGPGPGQLHPGLARAPAGRAGHARGAD